MEIALLAGLTLTIIAMTAKKHERAEVLVPVRVQQKSRR
jgi:hypothetical protein